MEVNRQLLKKGMGVMVHRWMACLLLLLPVWGVAGQTSGVEITYPQPVSLLQGTVEVRGSITLPDEDGYYLQFRRLNDDLSPLNGENALWSPASLPREGSVTDGVLAEWNTMLVDDGIYQLELVVQRQANEEVRVPISPVRVANEIPMFEGARYSIPATGNGTPPATAPTVVPTITPTAFSPGGATSTPAPTRTAADRQVQVTASIQANVRLGDSPTYPAIDFLDIGDTVPAIGQSNRSTWLQVRLPDGDVGFIAPSTVRIEGDTNFLPRVEPPPLPFTPTPVPTQTPIATATPLTQANLVFDSVSIDPSDITCGETFTIFAMVRNAGTGPTSGNAPISVLDRHMASLTIAEAAYGAVPQLDAGETFQAIIPMTVTVFYNETHRVTLQLDSTNAVPETNEGDNTASYEYTLEQGDCG